MKNTISFYDSYKTLNRTKAVSSYKRSVFLINPRFQLKFSLIVCFVILIPTLIYPLIIYDFFDLLAKNAPEVTTKLASAKSDLILYLILIQLVITVIVLVVFIFLTHRIAGPLYKLKKHLLNIREGADISPLYFRSGDYFHDVADEVSLFLETIQNNQDADFQYIDEISQYISNLALVVPDDKKPVLSEISRRLLIIQSRYKKPL